MALRSPAKSSLTSKRIKDLYQEAAMQAKSGQGRHAGIARQRKIHKKLLEDIMTKFEVHSNESLIVALQAVDLFVSCYLTGGGEQWAAKDSMPDAIWGTKKRIGRKEAASKVEIAYRLWCQERNIPYSLDIEWITQALKKRAEDKQKAVLEEKQRGDEEAAGDINPEEFFSDWIETGYRMLQDSHPGILIGPQQVLGAASPRRMSSEATWQYPANIRARLRTDWRTYARSHKKRFTQDVATDTLLKEKLPEVMQSILGRAAESLRDATLFNCQGDNHKEYFDLIDPLLATLYKDYANVTDARKQLYKAAFYHWQWQVKRSLWGRDAGNDIFIVLYGPGRGGKDEFINAILGNHLSPWRYGWSSLAAITKTEQNGAFLSDYLIGYVREMAEPSPDRLAALKGIVTDKFVDQRTYFTQESRCLNRRVSFISASNYPIVEIINDPTGMARFVEVAVDADKAYRLANRRATEGVRDNFKHRHSLDLFRLVNENEEDCIFNIYPELGELLALHHEEIRGSSDTEMVISEMKYHKAPISLPPTHKFMEEEGGEGFDKVVSRNSSGAQDSTYSLITLRSILHKWSSLWRMKHPNIGKDAPAFSVLSLQMSNIGFERYTIRGIDYVLVGDAEVFMKTRTRLDMDDKINALEERIDWVASGALYEEPPVDESQDLDW